MESTEDVCTYEVQAGDTLSAIAARFGYVTPTQLAKINKLPIFAGGLPPVFPGQKLIIPTASRGTTNPMKLRIAPGAALRVRSGSSDNPSGTGIDAASVPGFTIDPEFYAHHARGDQNATLMDDDAERQFVKVKAQRKLPSGDFVDGILLITPDSLCFDALRTAIAQKQAYLESHRLSRSSSFDANAEHEASDVVTSSPTAISNSGLTMMDPGSPSQTGIRIPKELLELGLCVPLGMLASMSTLRMLPLSCVRNPSDDAISSSRACTNGCTSPYPDDLDNMTDAFDDGEAESEMKNTETPLDANLEGEQLHQRESRCDSVSSEPPSEPASPPLCSVTDSHAREASASPPACSLPTQDILHSPSTEPNSSSSTRPSQSASSDRPPSNANESIDHTPVVNNETCQNDLPDTLYLRLTEVAKDDKAANEHIFGIPANQIPEVLAFLLRNGVGHSRMKNMSNGSTSSTGANYNRISTSLRPMRSSMDSSGSFPRRSLVEEALESMECASPLPVLYGGTSTILNEDMLEDLGANFPSHWIGCNLSLIYKTEQDGYSLNTLYRKSQHVQGGVLLVIRDTMGTVFGAIMSERIHCSKHFYGTGETCVFQWAPAFKRYDWTKKNDFFMRGSANSFQIGGQSGRNAIWFDEALKYGRSEPTDTFDNPVLSGTLPAFRLTPLSVNESQTVIDKDDPGSRPRSQTDPGSPSTPGVNSVPFLIDSLEVWELVS